MDPLDALPLEVLLALQDALVDPTEVGRARAARRARDAGYHVAIGDARGAATGPEVSEAAAAPIPMAEGDPAAGAERVVVLSFDGAPIEPPPG